MKTPRHEHPFLIWYAYLHKRRMASLSRKDLHLTDDAASRFAIGVEEDSSAKTPVLGVGVFDARAIKTIEWASAGIIVGHRNRDWIALAAKDIRPIDSTAPEPVPLRMWIPFPTGLFDAWLKTSPHKLELKRVKNGKGALPVFEKSPFLSVALQLKNNWGDLPG
ncbi:hypothetical protein [Salipiger sp. PrR003]|uniref:hypothetical protein n=1 Tax=Salipiger sp. PrR003 TaxID=2706776 RepID=UPI0013DBD805|nr:hypothetical protein [Salipiger sp. PrR003]NDV52778.1 hypothetical protein [Salipiger sp. PrR003]